MDKHLKNIKQRSKLDLKNEKQIIELESLFEFSKLLSKSIRLNDILNNIMFTIMGRMMISKSAALIKKNNLFIPALTKGIKFKEEHFQLNDIPDSPFILSNTEIQNFKQFSDYKLEIAIPFMHEDDVIGLIFFGKKLTAEAYSDSEINFLSTLCRIATPSIKNSLMIDQLLYTNQELDYRVQQLLTLMEIGQRLNATLDFDEIVKSISRSLMGQLLISKHAVLYEFDQGCKLVQQRGLKLTAKTIEYIRSQACELYLDENLVKDDVVLVMPLLIQNKVNGFLICGSKMNQEKYREDEKDFLKNIANIAASALENAILFEETLEKQKLEEELRLAKSIQRRLLPKNNPVLCCGEIVGTNDSSKQVGGDYFDFISLEKDSIGIAIGDVSGKGASAALLMSNLQATMHALTLDRSTSIENYMAYANSIIYKNTSSEKYITFFYGELDQVEMTFKYVNAGHNYPIIFRKNELIELKTGGIILGMMEGLPYEHAQVKFQKDDVVIFYTDGITEAMDTNEEEFGENRLIEVVRKNAHLSAQEIHKSIISSVFEFSPNANEFDDITLIVLKIK